MPPLLRALRLHHWAKNVLVFVPLATALRVADLGLLGRGAVAFAAFSLCASATYLLNDYRDRAADRAHPRKHTRPFAAGTLTAGGALGAAAGLLAAGFGLALLFLPPAFAGLLALYLGTNAAYSLGLKRLAVLDVLLLAGFYVLRLFAGGVATATPPSPWLLAFSTFFFLSLAVVKRYAEVARLPAAAAAPGRAYRRDDDALLRAIGTASGYLSVLVLALYINSEQVVRLYTHPERLWLLMPVLLYWITRVWLLAHRGAAIEDPLVFAFRDPASYLTAVLVAVVMLAAAV